MYEHGEMTLTVDYKHKQAELLGKKFHLADKVTIGGALSKSSIGKSTMIVFYIKVMLRLLLLFSRYSKLLIFQTSKKEVISVSNKIVIN